MLRQETSKTDGRGEEETKTQLQKTRTREQDKPDQIKHRREQKAAEQEEDPGRQL